LYGADITAGPVQHVRDGAVAVGVPTCPQPDGCTRTAYHPADGRPERSAVPFFIRIVEIEYSDRTALAVFRNAR
jgi:hypothetical protein